MPWQRLVWDVAGEYDAGTGLLFYDEILVTVMRQQGKTTTLKAGLVDRGVSPDWGGSQRMVYSAQTGDDARKKLLRDWVPSLEKSVWGKLVANVRRRPGDEGLEWRNGSLLDLMSSTPAAGHGRVVDVGVIDEAFSDEDARREQAVRPAMATRDYPQLWLASTAGTSSSTYLRRKVEIGRHASESNRGRGVAYFEWSVPEDADIDDPEVWWAHMPALGHLIRPEVVESARQSMEESEFRRAYMNQWTETEHDRIIPESLWLLVCSEHAAPVPVVFGLDVMPDRSSGAIVVTDGRDAEVVDHRPTVTWMVDRGVELHRRHGGEFAVDGRGPAVPVADDLERNGVPVRRLTTGEYAVACGRVYDAVADRRIRVRPHPGMDEALEGLAKRPSGDRWLWSRKASTTDVSPWTALTVGWSAATDARVLEGPLMA